MNGYQIAIIALWAMGLTVNIVKHGQPKDDYNAVDYIVCFLISLWIFIKAGLFS